MYDDVTYETLLKEKILDRYDLEELLTLLNVDPSDLLDRLWDLIELHREELDIE